jgi:glutaredoxin
MEARRCNIHGLVAGSDGRCVICRRGDDMLPKPSQALISPTTWLIVGVGVVTGSLMIWGLNRIQERLDNKRTAQAEAPIRPANEPAPPPEPVATGWKRRPEPASIATSEPTTTADEDPDAQLEAAKKTVKITLYGTSWCPHCKRARRFMNEKGLAFTDLDIESSPTDKVLLESINPKASIPTLDIEGEVMIGWSTPRFEELLTKVAEKKLTKVSRRGVTSVP